MAAGALALRPGWRAGWRERLGAGPVASNALWIHAASVGEVTAAARLVAQLRARGHSLQLSTTSTSGRALCEELHPGVARRLAPLDHPWCVDTVLRRARPRALVLIETEIWPVWIAACERNGVPVVVVSARISDRSLPRYRWLGSWLRASFARLTAIGARTEQDRERFVALGAVPERVTVVGDLKLDPPDATRTLAPELAAWLGDAPLVIAGSTHAGEEEALLAAQRAWEAAGRRRGAVLAPRHPQRAGEVVALARRSGRRVVSRSECGAAPLRAGDVGVLDTLGELSAIYARAAIAFVGGTLVPIGGHNVLEPVAAGVPAVYGSHLANVRHAAALLEAVGAGEVAQASALGDAIGAALADPDAARARGAAGCAALEVHRGASERSAALVEAVLTPRRALTGGN